MNNKNLDKNIAKPGLNARIVEYFLHNGQITLLLFLMLVVVGAGSFFKLRVEGFPELKVPVAVVTTVVPGAGPETVRETVTSPIENSLKDLDGLSEISSTSQANLSVIVLNFTDNTDLNVAVQDARNKVSSVKLPEGIIDPQIIIPETGGAPYFVAITGQADLVELRKQADILKEKLVAIKGVKSFSNISGAKEKIYIELGPQYQTPEVINQIKSSNIGFPIGESNLDGKRIPVVAKSDITSLEALRNVKINISTPESKQVALSDIASVYLGVDYGGKVHRVGYLNAEQNKFNIGPALLYELRLDKDADLLKIDKDIQKTVSETASSNDKVKYAIVFDQAKETQKQVNEILAGAVGEKWGDDFWGNIGWLFGGIWLLVIAMLLFLDLRSALISALAIPLSFLFTFIVLNIAGIQMNTLVLFSFVLVLGLIVDPAIVVLESIRRYVDLGYKGRAAVIESSKVIGLGLFVAVVTSMIVFVPFGVVSGTFGQLIAYIPWTVFPALIASYFVPLIFLTWLAAKLIKPEPGAELKDEDDVHTLWKLAQWFIKANRYILNRTWLSVLVVVLGLLIPIGVTGVLFASNAVRQVQFSQPDDSDYLQVSIPRPVNQTYRDGLIMATDVENILKNHIAVIDSFFYQSMDGGSSNNTLNVFIVLKSPEDRDVKSPAIVKDLQKELKDKFGDRAVVGELAAGPPGEAYPVSLKVFENDPAKQADASAKIVEQLKGYSEVDLVVSDFETRSKEMVVKVDDQKAAAAGLTKVSIYGQLSGILAESTLFKIEDNDVVLRVSDDAKPNTKDALLSAIIFGSNGPVKLSDVASLEEVEVPASIRSLNGERYAQVSASLKDSRDAINIQRKITDWAKSHTSELGVNDRAFEDRAGVNEFEKSFQELFLAIFLSILVTYVAFVIFFRSFAQPLIILFAIPLILIGVFPALAIFARGQFGFLETIGILMVIGIAENVGIFLIDYANRKVRSGQMDKKEAIAIASGIRLRPIVLTKITALAGLLPLAVFSAFWRGLALTVIFGILTSGVLSLFTTPVLYNWFTRIKSSKNDEETPLPEEVITETEDVYVEVPVNSNLESFGSKSAPDNLPV